MKNIERKINSIIKEINSDKIDYQKWSIIVATFNFNSFYKNNYSISNFFKKLTNGKITLANEKNNRDWWLGLGKPRGFYRYHVTRDNVKIMMVLDYLNDLNEESLIKRINKIAITNSIIVSYKDYKLFSKEMLDVFSIDQGFEVFGDYKKTSI